MPIVTLAVCSGGLGEGGTANLKEHMPPSFLSQDRSGSL